MKRNTILFMAAMVVAIVACNREEQPQAENANTIKSFSISMPVMSNDSETKTGLVEDGGKYNKLVWKTGDVVYVARVNDVAPNKANTFTYQAFSTTSNDTQDATFTAVGTGIEPDSQYIVAYTGASSLPYNANAEPNSCYGKILNTTAFGNIQLNVPHNQTYVEDGIAPLTMPMYAIGSDLQNMAFHCLGNIVRLNLYSTTADVKITRITLTSDITVDGEDKKWNGIAGEYCIKASSLETLAAYDTSFGLYNPYATSGTSTGTVVLDCSTSSTLSTSAGSATAFNIVISRRNNGLYDATNFSGGTSNITATIEWKIGEVPQTPKEVVLTKLTRERRVLLGQIFNFGAKDITDLPAQIIP